MSEELKGAIREEVRLLDKKVELLKLRIEEAGNTRRAEYLKVTGRELHQCARRLESAVAAEPDLNTRQGWLPIETAPKKEGSEFLGYRPDAGVMFCELRCVDDDEIPTLFTNGGFEDLTDDPPTHWQPLPEPPKD